VGISSRLEGRVWQHKTKAVEGFTSRYNIGWLVWYGCTGDVREAIAMEKRIKGWTRAKKIELIEEMNPQWRDLSADWYDNPPHEQ
jgi:putative endonuclease